MQEAVDKSMLLGQVVRCLLCLDKHDRIGAVALKNRLEEGAVAAALEAKRQQETAAAAALVKDMEEQAAAAAVFVLIYMYVYTHTNIPMYACM